MSSDINEKKIRDKNPKNLVLKLALAKAKTIAPKLKQGILITCDQITFCNGKILEKARSINQAEIFLRSYSNNSVENITGLVVTNLKTGRQISGVDSTKIVFKEIPDEFIEKILKDKYVLNYCGAAFFGDPIWKSYIKKVLGDPTTMFGISINLMKRLIKQVQ